MCFKCIIMDLTNSLMTAIFINDIPMWPYTCYSPCYFKCQKSSSQVLFCLVNQVCQFCQSLWELFIILPDIVGVSKSTGEKNIQHPIIIERLTSYFNTDHTSSSKFYSIMRLATILNNLYLERLCIQLALSPMMKLRLTFP